MPGFALDSAKPAAEKWRPKDGLYASPDKDFENQCGEYGDVIVELAEKSISGREWSCEITKLTDTAPGAIKLDMTCNDYNLAENINERDPNPYGRKFKEIMLLKKIDEKTIFVRKTLNGKFKDPRWHAAYCSEEMQRSYSEAKAKDKADKVPEQLSNPEQWRPRDGVYTSPGGDFDDRCTKLGDVIVGLSKGLVSSGKAECKVVGMMNTGLASVSMNMVCSETSGKQTTSPKTKNGETTPDAPGTETIRLSKVDDNTFVFQKTQNRQFKNTGGPVSYCPEQVQRSYAAQKAKK
jgi:hypothetical protein